MHASVIARVLGLLLMVFSLTMLPPILVASIYEENTSQVFFLAFALTFSTGIIIWLPFSRKRAELRTRDGFLITVLFWLELGLAGAIPLMLSETPHLSLPDAVFESISGLTTTGATVMTGLDDLPRSILYYRQQLQWLGGIGIVVIAVAIMPMLGVGGMQLYRAETPGPVKDNKLTPRIAQTAKVLFGIYLTLTLICAMSYYYAGMSLFDAICHSYATIAIGGFSTHDASIGYFDSHVIMMICIVFMIISGINFALHYYTVLRHSVGHYWRNPEARMYLSMMAGGCVLVCGYLFLTGTYNGEDSLYHGVFQLVSLMTTTGFATQNFSQWPTFLPMLMLCFSFFGACAGSTGGGIKIGRMQILAKESLRQINRLIHPNAVVRIKLRNKTVPNRVVEAVWAFFGVYLAAYYIMVLLIMATGLDYTTAWSATAAAMNNLGPGLGDVSAHYGDISDFAKLILCGGMLLGRLEIFTLLVLFSPAFWRH